MTFFPRTRARNIEDEPGASIVSENRTCWKLRWNKQQKQIPNKSQWCKAQGHRSKMKKLPGAKAGTISVTKLDYNPTYKINIHQSIQHNDWINKGGERNLPCRIPSSLCRYSPLKEGRNFPFLQCVKHSDFLWKGTVLRAEGGRVIFLVEKPDKHYFTQVIKININSDKLYWRYESLIWLDKMELYLCGFPPENF